MTRIKITPRARRLAAEYNIDISAANIKPTGYDGGISEKDVRLYIEDNKVKASPLAMKIAAVEGIDLKNISGSGQKGKIMKADVIAASVIANDEKTRAAVQVGTVDNGAAETVASGGMTADGKELLEVVPYAGVRKIIGNRLAESKFTAPHLYFTQKVNLDELLKLRKSVNSAQTKKTSVTDYIAKAVINTLVKFPDMNASLVGENIEKYKSVNLGIAVAAPTGLIVPNVKSSEKKSLLEISEEASVLFEKARNGKLHPDEYNGGTFTISNLGMFGIENFTAIINPPEIGILAISATKDEPLVVTGKDGIKSVEIRPMMNITLSVDHRVIDGLLAAEFVTEIKRVLENPLEILL